MKTMNKDEQRALFTQWDRANNNMSYLQFRRLAFYSHMNGCWMVPWCNIWLGIEADGHVHS